MHRSVTSKISLLLGSLIFIFLIGKSWQTTAFIFCTVTLAYPVIALADRVIRDRDGRDRAAAASITVALVGLIVANLSGFLGTLTGTTDSLGGQLPILLGVSFYALQVAGVASDVFRDLIPRPRLLDYLVFILLGFKFLSGPLECGIDLEKIVNRVVPLSYKRLWDGFTWVVLGFFMKFVIANPLSTLIGLNTNDLLSTIIVAIIAELLIYFDFAGYSFMALGFAEVFGIQITNNFAQPFFASNIREFWRRWHISLGQWLRNYIYLPLRDFLFYRKMPMKLATVGVFIVSGLWHGATINLFIWATIHVVVFILFVQIFSKYKWSSLVGRSSLIMTLIFARIWYIDQNFYRVVNKITSFDNINVWHRILVFYHFMSYESIIALILAVMFIALEGVSERINKTNDYKIFRSSSFF